MRIPSVVLAVPFVLAFTSLSWGQGLTGAKTVGGSSADYATPADAITALQTQGVGTGGVAFRLRPGTYTGPVTVTYASSSDRPVLFQRDPATTTSASDVVVEGSGPCGAVWTLHHSKFVTIDGITLKATNHHGVAITGTSSNNTVSNCVIQVTGTDGEDHFGVHSTDSTTGTLVERNRISVAGIAEDAHCRGVYGHGFVAVRRNWVQGCGEGADDGIETTGPPGTSTEISNNRVVGFDYTAVRVYKGDALVVYNTLYGLTGDGPTHRTDRLVSHESSGSVVCLNNILLNAGDSDSKYGIYRSSSSCSLTSDYNLFYVPNGASVGKWGEKRKTLAEWQAATGQDLHSFVANPVLQADLHLGAGSPAMNTGTTVSSVTVDLDGDARPSGFEDIGADEASVDSSQQSQQDPTLANQTQQNQNSGSSPLPPAPNCDATQGQNSGAGQGQQGPSQSNQGQQNQNSGSTQSGSQQSQQNQNGGSDPSQQGPSQQNGSTQSQQGQSNQGQQGQNSGSAQGQSQQSQPNQQSSGDSCGTPPTWQNPTVAGQAGADLRTNSPVVRAGVPGNVTISLGCSGAVSVLGTHPVSVWKEGTGGAQLIYSPCSSGTALVAANGQPIQWTWNKKDVSGSWAVAGTYMVVVGPVQSGASLFYLGRRIALTPSGKIAGNNLFPLTLGNQWTFSSVVMEASQYSGSWLFVKNVLTSDGDRWLRRVGQTLYTTWNLPQANPVTQTLFRFGCPLNSTFTSTLLPAPGKFRVKNLNATLLTGAGSFGHCYRIDMEGAPIGSNPIPKRVFFAPGVGMVGYTLVRLVNGQVVEETHSLQKATLKGSDGKWYTVGVP